jgi:hypothetical protein
VAPMQPATSKAANCDSRTNFIARFFRTRHFTSLLSELELIVLSYQTLASPICSYRWVIVEVKH